VTKTQMNAGERVTTHLMNMASSSALTLDDLENTTAPNPTENTHLSYPVLGESEPISKENSDSTSEREARPLLTDRLYIGNLHPSVDEYVLALLYPYLELM